MSKVSNLMKWLSCCIFLVLMPLYLLSCTGGNIVSEQYRNPNFINSAAINTTGLDITLTLASPEINTITADPDNLLLLKAQVRDSYGNCIEGARIRLHLAGVYDPEPLPADKGRETEKHTENLGRIPEEEGLSGTGGAFYAAYSPPAALDNDLSGIKITANIEGSKASSTLTVKLVPVPVVLVHGYQATHEIFSGLAGYLQEQGFSTLTIDYNSRAGVAPAAEELSDYLAIKKADLAASGIQTARFDIIAHSMGGLVARYYTSSSDYAKNGNVRKLIFFSVPQKGSYFATLGQKYFNDASISDMSSDSELFTHAYPEMINEGLNPSIQTASILGMYDEVVSTSSADLKDWDIDTEIYEVGENNLTVDKLLTGELLNATNHKLILYNGKVFKRIVEMLKTNLPFPAMK